MKGRSERRLPPFYEVYDTTRDLPVGTYDSRIVAQDVADLMKLDSRRGALIEWHDGKSKLLSIW